MGKRARRETAGFSLIELLIVVAITAALVGVAVPFFQDNVAEAQRAKAREDLQVLQKVIAAYEAKEGQLLLGTTLGPLLGRYLEALPKDPWGNAYLWDGAAGFLASYGADGLPGGSGSDSDVLAGSGLTVMGRSYQVLPVMLRRAQYQGNAGPPRPPGPAGAPDWSRFAEGNKFVLTFSRSVYESNPAALPGDFLLIDPPDAASGLSPTYLTEPLSFLPGTWRSAGDPFFPSVDPLHRPGQGVVVLRATVDNAVAGTRRLRLEMGIRMDDTEDTGSFPAGLTTTYTVGADPISPLEPAAFGPGASAYMPPGVVTLTEGPTAIIWPAIRIEKY